MGDDEFATCYEARRMSNGRLEVDLTDDYEAVPADLDEETVGLGEETLRSTKSQLYKVYSSNEGFWAYNIPPNHQSTFLPRRLRSETQPEMLLVVFFKLMPTLTGKENKKRKTI